VSPARRIVPSPLAALVVVSALSFVATAAAAAQREDPPQLPGALERIVTTSALGPARAGILVADLETGAPVFAHRADELLNPASNTKILTTVAALGILGPNYRFATEVTFERDLERGVLAGSLFLRGKGDPSLDTGRLFGIVRALQHRGLKEVKGDVVVDDTYFDETWEGPGWEQDDSDSAYMAPIGAVSLETNTVEIHVRPGDVVGGKGVVEVEPASAYFTIENRTETAPDRARQRVQVRSEPDGDRQKIVVSARLPFDGGSVAIRRRISNPSLYTGETLKALLEEVGIRVRGKVRRGITPWKLEPAVVDLSEDLTVLVHRVNKVSQNHMTEQLLKAVGAESKGAPGTWDKGVDAVEEFLARRVAIPRGSFVMRNGSGLNDTNRVSARQLVRVLRWACREDLLGPSFLASLPIAGIDGTTRNRMAGTLAVGRLRAKTGTLQNVTALSGFVGAVDGKRYVFSILVNDFPGRLSSVLPAVDAIGTALAADGDRTATLAAVASANPPPAQPTTPLEVLRARLRVYDDLARAKSAHNLAFLGTALRSERDPALRAAIAEALWRSDRTDGTGARALLESFDGTPEVFGRLRDASADLPAVPGLEAILDLAADGNAEALAKLVEVAAASAGDARVEAELADGFSEVGRTAPAELLAALAGASEPARDAVVDLIARALLAGERAVDGQRVPPSAGHPFLAALAVVAGGADPAASTHAKALEARLAERMARLAAVPAPVTAIPAAGPAPVPVPGGG
jgi:D-alanyl-D-alanine carboxypeptidase/D-alanyl-D-alanine-endopeptidase (penicillin-binding protein 4)